MILRHIAVAAIVATLAGWGVTVSTVALVLANSHSLPLGPVAVATAVTSTVALGLRAPLVRAAYHLGQQDAVRSFRDVAPLPRR